eukprot:SAG11_NODE_25539_length_357_cov_1.178295_1_plen_72_part_10
MSAATQATKDKYKNRTRTEEERMENRKHSTYFEAKISKELDESKVNKTHPDHKSWVDILLANKNKDYKCLTP